MLAAIAIAIAIVVQVQLILIKLYILQVVLVLIEMRVVREKLVSLNFCPIYDISAILVNVEHVLLLAFSVFCSNPRLIRLFIDHHRHTLFQNIQKEEEINIQ